MQEPTERQKAIDVANGLVSAYQYMAKKYEPGMLLPEPDVAAWLLYLRENLR